jgi:NAD(P)-dependent dehydrogenase (short-subunit alcohol dehydrogenase family)
VGATTFDFSGQVAVVTGACHGIGKGSVDGFADAGAHAVLLDIDEAAGKSAVEEIRGRGREASFYRCDVTSSEEVNETFASIATDLGRIDALLLSAGGFTKKLGMAETTDDEWHRVMALNLTSAFFCTRAAVPVFKRQRSGAIIYIGSGAGLTGVTASPPYSAAKAGVHSLAPFGVTSNAIAPGTTSTERVDKLHGEEGMQRIGESNPLGRVGQVSDTVGAVLFLSSPEGSYITGQTLSVDGGRLMV